MLRLPFPNQSSSSQISRVQDTEGSLFRYMVALHVCCVGLTLILAIATAIWGVNYNLEQVRLTLLQSHMQRLRSHALRTIGTIQKELRVNPSGGLEQLRSNEAIRRHW